MARPLLSGTAPPSANPPDLQPYSAPPSGPILCQRPPLSRPPVGRQTPPPLGGGGVGRALRLLSVKGTDIDDDNNDVEEDRDQVPLASLSGLLATLHYFRFGLLDCLYRGRLGSRFG